MDVYGTRSVKNVRHPTSLWLRNTILFFFFFLNIFSIQCFYTCNVFNWSFFKPTDCSRLCLFLCRVNMSLLKRLFIIVNFIALFDLKNSIVTNSTVNVSYSLKISENCHNGFRTIPFWSHQFPRYSFLLKFWFCLIFHFWSFRHLPFLFQSSVSILASLFYFWPWVKVYIFVQLTRTHTNTT